MNKHFKAWAKALDHWDPPTVQRLARGRDDRFAFLGDEGIGVEVLGPTTVVADGREGLELLHPPRSGSPTAHLDFRPARSPSASHTINGQSIVLRMTYGNVRMLFAGDLNNAAEQRLVAEGVPLESEVLKVPHHGSHEYEDTFLAAVAPVVSVVSSGDESSRTEYIHPRATLVSGLGRHGRSTAPIVLVTELVAFFQLVGPAVTVGPRPRPFFGFERTAYGLVRVRTDGTRILVFTDSGKRDVKEAYAYRATAAGVQPVALVK
jgi:hypothetical protein